MTGFFGFVAFVVVFTVAFGAGEVTGLLVGFADAELGSTGAFALVRGLIRTSTSDLNFEVAFGVACGLLSPAAVFAK